MSRALYQEEQLIPWNNRSHASSFSRTKFRGVDVGPARLIQPLQNERRKGIVIDHSYRGRETGGTPFLVKDNIELSRYFVFVPSFLVASRIIPAVFNTGGKLALYLKFK